jgi:hypothetical protein
MRHCCQALECPLGSCSIWGPWPTNASDKGAGHSSLLANLLMLVAWLQVHPIRSRYFDLEPKIYNTLIINAWDLGAT